MHVGLFLSSEEFGPRELVGPDQDAFFDTWAQEILPRFHDQER